MPFKSKAQQRFMFATMPETAHEWAHETKSIKKLPEKVKKAGVSNALQALPRQLERVLTGTGRALLPSHIGGGIGLANAGKSHADRVMKDATKRLEEARKEKHAMNQISLRAFREELADIEKTADMLTRRNVAAQRGQAAAKMNAPHPEHAQMGFQFGNTVGTKPPRQLHSPLVQKQMQDQGIAKQNFHERSQRAAQSAVHQPEQTEMNLQTRKQRLAAKSKRAPKPVPSKAGRVVSGAGKAGKGLLGAGVGLAGAGLLGAGLVGHALTKREEPEQSY